MPSIPNPYILLAAAGLWIASLIGAGLFWGHHVSLGYEVSISKQKIQAGTILAGALQKVRDKENADADKARKIDEKHAVEIADANAGRDAFAAKLLIARRGASCPNTRSPETPHPSEPEKPTASSDLGLGEIDTLDPGLQARDGVKDLIAYVNAAHEFVLSCGR